MFDMKLLADKVIFEPSELIDLRQYYNQLAKQAHQSSISESALSEALSAHLNEHLRGIEFSIRQNLVKRLISEYLLNEQVHQLSYYDVATLLLSLNLPTKQLLRNLQGWILMSTEYALPEQDLVSSLTYSKLMPESEWPPEKPEELPELVIEAVPEEIDAEIPSNPIDADTLHTNLFKRLKQYKEQFRYGFIIGLCTLLLTIVVLKLDSRPQADFDFRDVCYMLQRADHKPQALSASVKLVYETSKDGIPAYLRYSATDENRLKGYLKRSNSMLANDPYFSAIMEAAAKMDVNPLLLFAITGQEQNFVRRGSENAALIVNNPFNVYHSWVDYNTNIKDASLIAATTIYIQLDKRPAMSDPFKWLNETYAEDPKWHKGVEQIFLTLDGYCNLQ